MCSKGAGRARDPDKAVQAAGAGPGHTRELLGACRGAGWELSGVAAVEGLTGAVGLSGARQLNVIWLGAGNISVSFPVLALNLQSRSPSKSMRQLQGKEVLCWSPCSSPARCQLQKIWWKTRRAKWKMSNTYISRPSGVVVRRERHKDSHLPQPTSQPRYDLGKA